MSTTYNIIYSPQAFLDLTELYEYIRFNLQVPKTAEKQVNRIRKPYALLRLCLYDIHLLIGIRGVLKEYAEFPQITTQFFTKQTKIKLQLLLSVSSTQAEIQKILLTTQTTNTRFFERELKRTKQRKKQRNFERYGMHTQL